MEAIIHAIQENDSEALRQALTPGKLETPIGEEGVTPLGHAIAIERPQLVSLLLEQGADPMRPDSSGLTPLLRGLQGGRAMAELLLDTVVERGLIDRDCRRAIMRSLMGKWFSMGEEEPCLDRLEIPRKIQGELFDHFSTYATCVQERKLLEKVRDFCASYRDMALGIAGVESPVPDAETLLAFVLRGEHAQRVEPWLKDLRERLSVASAPTFAWEVYRPVLAGARSLGSEHSSGELYERWLLLEAPFFSLEEHLAGLTASGVVMRFDQFARAVGLAARSGFYDLEQWILTLASAIDAEQKGIASDNPLLALVDEKNRDFFRHNPRRFRNDAFEHLRTLTDVMLPAFGDLSAFIDALTSSQRMALAADRCSALRDQPGGWLAMARALQPHGLLPWKAPDRNDTVSWEGMADWAINEASSEMATELLARIGEDGRRYQGGETPQGRVQERLLARWIDSDPGRLAVLGADHVQLVSDSELLRTLILHPSCRSAARHAAISNLGHHLDRLELDETLLVSFRADFVKIWCEQWSRIPESWMELLWKHRSSGEERPLLLKAFAQVIMGYEDEGAQAADFALFKRWYLEDVKLSDKALAGLEYGELESYQVADAAWDWLGPTSRRAFLRFLASDLAEFDEGYGTDPLREPVALSLLDKGMLFSPATLLKKPAAAKWVLSRLCDEAFEPSLPYLRKQATSKPAQAPVARGIARLSPAVLAQSGLLSDKDKAVRDLALRGLCSRDDADALPLLEECIGYKASHWNDTQRSHLLDRLERFGADIADRDPLLNADAEAFETHAEKGLKGKRSDPLARLWNPRIDELGLPFSRRALTWASTLLAKEEWGRMPRAVRQLLGLCGDEQGAELVSRLAEAWIQGSADNKDRWVLRLVPAFGDDRVVPQLKEAVAQWQKKYYQRAALLAKTLGELDTTYALYTLDEIQKGSKNRDVVREAAAGALREAAGRRGIPLAELYDELVPTLDMGPEGLVLDVGPYAYQVQLLSDLSLRVTHGGTGKKTKSLPKAKQGEDPELRAMAQSRFALLKKNVKPIVKQLGVRMEEALDCGKSWQAERWQRLFLGHPILKLVGKNLIWTLDGARSFRISEDDTLIDLDDEPLELMEGEIRLWHPIEADEGEIEGWREHFEDYELIPFIPQLDAPVHGLTAAEQDAKSLDRFGGKQAYWGNVKRLMTKWDYRVYDQDGVHIAGYVHTYPLSGISVYIDMQECEVSMSHDDVCTLGSIDFRKVRRDDMDDERLTLQRIHPRLLASVIEKINRLVIA